MIPLIIMTYGILTPIVIRGHLRSLEVKKRSNLKNAPRDTIFGIYTHMIFLTNIGYSILNQKGHKRSPEFTGGQKKVKIEKSIQG